MSEDRVAIEIHDHVADVRMVRGEKHNALDRMMFVALADAAERLGTVAGVRAVVLSGDGPSFCSGLDLASLAGGGAEEMMARPQGEIANLAQRVAYGWVALPAPVIAAIHGNCFGGGLQIALGADIRFAAPDARLSIMESKWGLIPDMGISHTLPRLVSIDVAKELTFTGRVLSGTEAHGLGLVTHLAEDPAAAARELAVEITERSPDAVREAKRLYERTWQEPTAEGLRMETELQQALIGSPNQIEAVRAAIARETPRFTDPAPG